MARRLGIVAALLLAPSVALAEPDVGPAPTPAELAAQLAELKALVAQHAATISDLQTNLELATAEPSPEPTFDIHGFIDMGLQKVFTNDDAGFESTASTFVLGNVNLYFTFHPAEHWSALTEVRFTNQPDGAQLGATRVSTEVVDAANGIGDDKMKWGAIVLERAYIQYEHSRELAVRVGQFLTPFGLWNVDHGTPTIIPIVRPESMTQELFPKRQVGVEVYGEHAGWLPGSWTVEYHGYVSNGRTPGQVDVTDDKMVGARLVLATTKPYRMAFGASVMYGGYSNQLTIANANDEATRLETIAYTELGYSFDGSLDAGAWRLRAEVSVRDLDYEVGKHAPLAPGVYEPSDRVVDAYALAAYRIPHSKLEPYLYTEAYRVPDFAGDLQLMGSAGLNVYFTPSIQLKLQALHSRFFDTADFRLRAGQEVETFVGTKLVMGF